VIVPAGRSVAGLEIHLDDARAGAERTTDSEGRFRFSGLPAGIHKLILTEVPGSIVDPPSMEVELAVGEQREVLYDLRRAGACQVTLTILVDSMPAVNADVELVTPSLDDASVALWRVDAAGRPSDFYRLGKTDSQGLVNGSAPARGAARVRVRFGEGMPVEHPDVELALEPDARIEAVVAYEFGRLVVVIPDRIAPPEQALLSVLLRQGKERRTVASLPANFDVRSPLRKVLFERVPSGEFEVEVTLTEIAHAGGKRTELFRGSQMIVIPQGGTTEVRFP